MAYILYVFNNPHKSNKISELIGLVFGADYDH